MIKSFFEKTIIAAPLLLALFYLQGIFYYSGMLEPFGVSRNLYAINFHEAFIWTFYFYTSKIVLFITVLIFSLLMLYPILKPVLDRLAAFIQDRLTHLLRKIITSKKVKSYITELDESKGNRATFYPSMWVLFIFISFLGPYQCGIQSSKYALAKTKCMLTNEKGDFKFTGNKTIYFKPEAKIKSNSLKNVSIVHRNNHYISVYDGKVLNHYPTSLVIRDSIEINLYESQIKSVKELACEAKQEGWF